MNTQQEMIEVIFNPDSFVEHILFMSPIICALCLFAIGLLLLRKAINKRKL